MELYRQEFAFERLIRTGPSVERTLLRVYTGGELSESDAKRLWQRIDDHKWYVSERLSRDIGFHVAAVDYVENFYKASPNDGQPSRSASAGHRFLSRLGQIFRLYFEAKGKTVSV